MSFNTSKKIFVTFFLWDIAFANLQEQLKREIDTLIVEIDRSEEEVNTVQKHIRLVQKITDPSFLTSLKKIKTSYHQLFTKFETIQQKHEQWLKDFDKKVQKQVPQWKSVKQEGFKAYNRQMQKVRDFKRSMPDDYYLNKESERLKEDADALQKNIKSLVHKLQSRIKQSENLSGTFEQIRHWVNKSQFVLQQLESKYSMLGRLQKFLEALYAKRDYIKTYVASRWSMLLDSFLKASSTLTGAHAAQEGLNFFGGEKVTYKIKKDVVDRVRETANLLYYKSTLILAKRKCLETKEFILELLGNLPHMNFFSRAHKRNLKGFLNDRLNHLESMRQDVNRFLKNEKKESRDERIRRVNIILKRRADQMSENCKKMADDIIHRTRGIQNEKLYMAFRGTCR